jgi:peptidoglycan hydrolase-like protein with peptidoglycan-binding domain
MLAMPLTNPAWEKNFRLQAATTGGNPVPKGDRGTHVAILRKNLEAVGFERTLEPIDFYGASTTGMIRDFRQIYNVPGNSELVDKRVLETIDAILNGKIPQRRFSAGATANVGVKGKDFAVRYLATTKEWVENALKTSRSVEQALRFAMKAGGANPTSRATSTSRSCSTSACKSA